MSGNSFGDQDEVRDALSSAVNDYGKRVLSDSRMLSSLIGDLIPDLPRERSLLITGADAGIADDLAQRVEGQRLDPNTAVNLVAESLMRSRGLDQASSTWVANEYAQALGYQVGRGDTQPIIVPPPFPPAPTPPPPPGGTPSPVPPTYVQQPPVAPTYVSPPPVPPTYVSPPQQNQPQQNQPSFNQSPPNQPQQNFPPQNQQPFNQPPQNFPQQTFPQTFPPPVQPPFNQPPFNQPPFNQPPRNQPKPRLALFSSAGVAVVVVIYLVIAATAHTFPFTKAAAVASPTPTPIASSPTSPVPTTASPTPRHSPSPSVSPSSSSVAFTALPAGLKKLKVLLPVDVVDATTQCVTGSGFEFTATGIVNSLYCQPPDLGTGIILSYQFDSPGDFNAAWGSFNDKVSKFGVATSEDCPPPSGDDKGGPEEWSGANFPTLTGQVLECYTGKNGPVYAWTYPTQNVFFVGVAPKGWTFTKLQTWWHTYSV